METAKPRYGSFQDSLKAPIHRWFTYPAGYSYKLVQAKIEENGLTPQHWIADPFLGAGTTSLAAKLSGVNSIGQVQFYGTLVSEHRHIKGDAREFDRYCDPASMDLTVTSRHKVLLRESI